MPLSHKPPGFVSFTFGERKKHWVKVAQNIAVIFFFPLPASSKEWEMLHVACLKKWKFIFEK